MIPQRWSWIAVGLLLYAVAFHIESLLFGRIYFSLDTFAYFYPMETYYASSLRAGQLPLWNPYIFGGAPFLANSQAGVYYPLNLAFLFGSIPNIYSLELAAHSLIAAGGMLWFGRRFVGLTWFGAIVAGLAFGFGGAIATMAGHLNQVQVAAWMPWMLGAGHQLVLRPGARPLVMLAIQIALQALAGHSQQLYIGLWALAVYSVWAYVREYGVGSFRLLASRSWRRLAVLAGAGLLAAGLSAAQMVPTLELANLSIRSGGLSYWEATAFSLPPFELVAALVPPVAGGAPFSEFVGYIGVTGLALSIFALAARFGGKELFWLAWSLVALLLAFGHFTALYFLFYELVPGFDVFRAPARWLLLFSFGASVLAGLGASHVGRLEHLRRAAGIAAIVVVAAIALAGVRDLLGDTEPVAIPAGWWWVAAIALASGLVLLRWRRRVQLWLLVFLLGAELLAGARQLDSRQVILADAFDQMRGSTAHILVDDSRFRVLSIGESTYDPGDLRELRRSLSPYMMEPQVEDYVDALKYAETFQPNLPMSRQLATIDGYDGGLLPLKRYLQIKQLFRGEGKELEDGRLRYQLAKVPDPELLGWLNVKYVVMDRTRDLWLDGIYYDLGLAHPIAPGQSVELVAPADFDTTTVGLMLSPASPDDGPARGLLTMITESGDSLEISFDSSAGRPVGDVREDLSGIHESKLPMPRTLRPARVRVTNLGQVDVDLRSLSLINEQTGNDRPIAASPSYRIGFLGDVKVYENLVVRDRFFSVGRARPAGDDKEMFELMLREDFNPRQEATVLADEWRQFGFDGAGDSGSLTVTSYEPGLITGTYEGATPALLVLTESHYPGWRAYIDGKEAPILLTNLMYQGVVSPAGEHSIEFRFEPASVRVGQIISAGSVIVALLLLVLGRRWPARG